MNFIKVIGIVTLLGGLASTQAQTNRIEINPALLYYQSFLQAPTPMRERDFDYLSSREGGRRKLPERFGELAAAYDSQFKLIRQAAKSTGVCDWGVDLSQGLSTVLPHLPQSKRACVAVQLRSIWELENGRQAEACEDLLAALALARNTGRDHTLIGSLVQYADEAIIFSTIAGNFGKFSNESAECLLKGLDNVPSRTTAASCIPSERGLWAECMRQVSEWQKVNGADDAKTMESIHKMYFTLNALPADIAETNVWSPIVRASGGTSQGFVKLLREVEPYYPRMAEVLALPHGPFEAQVDKICAEITNSPNPVLQVFLPPLKRSHTRELKIQVYEAMVRAAFQYRLHGEAGLKSVADPCGNGPFALRRFVFEGVDRGFELKSAYAYDSKPEVMIFVERIGTGFHVNGVHVGEMLPSLKELK